MNTERISQYYNPTVGEPAILAQTKELKILLALEPTWTVSLNGLEFLNLASSEITLDLSEIRFGKYTRKIAGISWVRPNIVRIQARQRFRSEVDVITLYAGDRLPSSAELRKRRRAFQLEIGPALCAHFQTRTIQRQTLYSDRRHAIGGAYPRFLIGRGAAITVDPNESPAVVNGIMRAAIMWAPVIRRRVAIVVPYGRHRTVASRLRTMPRICEAFDWLLWNGRAIEPFDSVSEQPETHVQDLIRPNDQSKVSEILGLAPDLLQAVPHIAGKAISIRLRGIEIARIGERETIYPLGEPLERVIRDVDEARRYGSRHPLARAHEESWLESNIIRHIGDVLPSIDEKHIYPQVPSFAGEERNIIDLLTVTREGRLVVIEIKASVDPDLPFQALDYWIAVERHRKALDFQAKGYFPGCALQNQPALLVLAAPLLAFHKSIDRLISMFPPQVPLMEIGIGQTWKKSIKILRRRGLLG